MDHRRFDPQQSLLPDEDLPRRRSHAADAALPLELHGVGPHVLHGRTVEFTSIGVTAIIDDDHPIGVFVPVRVLVPVLGQGRSAYIAWAKSRSGGGWRVGLQTEQPFELDRQGRPEPRGEQRRIDVRVDGLSSLSDLEAFAGAAYWVAATFRAAERVVAVVLGAPDLQPLGILGAAADGHGRAGLRVSAPAPVAELVRVLTPLVAEPIQRNREKTPASGPRESLGELLPAAAEVSAAALGVPTAFGRGTSERGLLRRALLPALAMLLDSGDRVRIQRLTDA